MAFQVHDILLFGSPFTGEDIRVNYRGGDETNSVVVFPGGGQARVATKDLRYPEPLNEAVEMLERWVAWVENEDRDNPKRVPNGVHMPFDQTRELLRKLGREV